MIVESIKRLESEKWRVKNLHIQLWKHLFNIDIDTSPLCLGFPPRSENFACKASLSRLNFVAIRHKCRPEIRSTLQSLLFKKAFTLAEILITLGIIGVIAALTLPTVITNYQKQATVSKLKKAYSELSQAIVLSEVENGPFYTWDLMPFGQSREFFDKYLRKYFKSTLKEDNSKTATLDSYAYTVILSNGSTLTSSVHPDYVEFTIKTDSKTSSSRNYFDYLIYQNKAGGYYTCSVGRKLAPLCEGGSARLRDREYLLNKCKSHPINCAVLIMHDGWQIKDDYPW